MRPPSLQIQSPLPFQMQRAWLAPRSCLRASVTRPRSIIPFLTRDGQWMRIETQPAVPGHPNAVLPFLSPCFPRETPHSIDAGEGHGMAVS